MPVLAPAAPRDCLSQRALHVGTNVVLGRLGAEWVCAEVSGWNKVLAPIQGFSRRGEVRSEIGSAAVWCAQDAEELVGWVGRVQHPCPADVSPMQPAGNGCDEG